MERMFFLLINLKQVGTIFQTADLMLSKIQDMGNTTQNMFITITFIAIFMKNQEQQEVSRRHHQVNSYQKVNSMTKADGDSKI